MRLPFARTCGLLIALIATGCFFTGCNTELGRARALLERGDHLFAAIFFEKALKRDPDNESALVELTKLYCDKLKRVSKCFEKSEILFQRNPKSEVVAKWYKGSLLTVAKGLFQEQRLRKASDYLMKYRKLDGKNGPVLFMLGNARFRLFSKPPLSANDKVNLTKSIQYLKESVEHSKPDTEVASAYNSKKKNVLQWESYMLMGRIYELYILEHFKKWRKVQQAKAAAAAKKAAEEAKKNKGKKKRRRKKKKEEPKEPPKFPIKMEDFNKAKDAYNKAAEIKQSNKYKRFLPSFRVGMMYANMLRNNEEAVKYLHKAEKLDSNNSSIVGNLKMMYDRLTEKAEKEKKKKLAKKYADKAEQYASQIASLRATK